MRRPSHSRLIPKLTSVLENCTQLNADIGKAEMSSVSLVNGKTFIRIMESMEYDKNTASNIVDNTEAVILKRNADIILKCSNARPFRWWRNLFCCSYCELRFADADSLMRHIRNCHSGKRSQLIERPRRGEPLKVEVTDLKCENCQLPMSGLPELIIHLVDVHRKNINTTYSDGVIPYRLDKNELRCLTCGELFQVFSKLNHHMNEHYQRYICEVCGKSFATPSRLRSHTFSHEQGEFPCKQCELSFATRTARESHRLRTHKAELRYRCPHCPVKIRSYSERMRHLTQAHNVKALVFKCELCPRVYNTCDARTKHIKINHLKKKDHKCELCAARFQTRGEVLKHMVRHTGDRKFQCDVCKKSYARLKTLREHMRIHNNDRRFACLLCLQAFVQKCSLKQHIKVHHPTAQPL